MTIADIDTADPRKLAEALRRECKQQFDRLRVLTWPTPTQQKIKQFAAALLGVLNECNSIECESGPTGSYDLDRYREAIERIIRTAARAWLAAGGELEVT